MKKLFFLMLVAVGVAANAQTNLVTNPGYENTPSTFTVTEGTAPVTNVLMRVAGLQDATTQTTNPTATATAIPAGMWVKKAAASGYIKGVVVTSDFNSGTSCLNLKITAGTTQTGLTSWYNCVNLQKLASGLNATKKYTASVWAKVDATANNQCTQMVLFVTDNTAKVNSTKTIQLTGGTTWTQYQVTFDLPTFVSSNPTADFSTAFFGLGITTTYDGSAKTLYSGLLIDDFSLTEEIPTELASTVQKTNISVKDGSISISGIEKNTPVDVFNSVGARIYSKSVQNSELSIPVANGIYIVKANNTTTKVLVNK